MRKSLERFFFVCVCVFCVKDRRLAVTKKANKAYTSTRDYAFTLVVRA